MARDDPLERTELLGRASHPRCCGGSGVSLCPTETWPLVSASLASPSCRPHGHLGRRWRGRAATWATQLAGPQEGGSPEQEQVGQLSGGGRGGGTPAPGTGALCKNHTQLPPLAPTG